MNSSLKWLFARRYLVSRKSHSVINIIAAVSVAAVGVSVAAMVVLMSVFNGFAGLVRETYAAVDADIEIRAAGGTASHPVFLEATDENRTLIASVRGVEAVSFVVERQALLEFDQRRTLASVRGVDDCYTSVVPVADYVFRGEAQVRLGDFDRMVLGEGLAYTLGVFSIYGNRVDLYSLGGGEIGSLLPLRGLRHEQIDVCGFFTIDRDNDGHAALVPLRTAARLFGTGSRADAALVRVAAGHSPRRVREELAAALGTQARVLTREEKNSAFYRIMRYEKWGVFFVSALVLLIASLSIVGTVAMLIVDKRREQPVLRSLGLGSGFLRGVFVREGLLIALLGGAGGLLAGVAVVAAQQHFGIISMPAGGFLVEDYPVDLQFTDIIAIFATFVAVALGVSLLAVRAMIRTNAR